jgi:hypothetical protein
MSEASLPPEGSLGYLSRCLWFCFSVASGVGSLSSQGGWIIWSIVSPLSIHPWSLLPLLSLLGFHSQVLSHLGSLILGLLFHMTHDSTHLDSLSSLHSPVSVKTGGGTPLPVVGQGALYTSNFHVLSVYHVPQLHLQLFLPTRLLIMIAVSFLILTFVLFWIVFGSLIDYNFLQLLLCAS